MATVRDLITDSLRELGALGVAEVATEAEAQDALSVLNDMLDTWRTESLLVYGINENIFPYVGGQSVYTIGAGGDLNMPRPENIQSAFNRDTNNNDYEIFATNDYQIFADLTAKDVSATLTSVLWYNAGVPLGTITLWPAPSDSSYRLVLWTWQIIQEFTSVNDVIVLPRGYKRAMKYNLAIELSARYGRPPATTTVSGAIESKAQLKRINTVVPMMVTDRSLGTQGYVWNYLSGGY